MPAAPPPFMIHQGDKGRISLLQSPARKAAEPTLITLEALGPSLGIKSLAASPVKHHREGLSHEWEVIPGMGVLKQPQNLRVI